MSASGTTGFALGMAMALALIPTVPAAGAARCDKEAGNDCRDMNPGTVDTGTASSAGTKKTTSGATNVKTPRDTLSGQTRGRRVHTPQ